MPAVGLTVQLHFDATTSTVWMKRADSKAVPVSRNLLSFVRHVVEEVGEVRLLGAKSNAELICRLYQSTVDRGTDTRLLIGSPSICQPSRSDDPEHVFEQMPTLDTRRASVGGWHEVTPADYASYRLAWIGQGRSTLTREADTIVRNHPAWPALSFIPTLDMAQAANLLATILDPRWYVSQERPDRHSKIRAYMGLVSQNARFACKECSSPGANYGRFQLLLRAWRGNSGLKPEEDDPRDFLRRCAVRQSDEAKGILKASSLFLNFVRSVWLDVINTSNQELFVPEYFFANDDPPYDQMTPRVMRRHLEELAD